MTAGKVRHWKHGWIPISPEAKAYVAGTGPKPGSKIDSLNAPRRTGPFAKAKITEADVPTVSSDGTAVIEKRVEGAPSFVYERRLQESPWGPGVHRLTDSEVREMAEAVTDALAPFPEAQKKPIVMRVVPANDPGLAGGAWAVTNQTGEFRVDMNQDLWDPLEKYRLQDDIRGSREAHFGITAENTTSIAQFRRNTITHEIGHVLHLREMSAVQGSDDDLVRAIGFDGNPTRGNLDELAAEEVTPRQMGYLRTRQDLINSGAQTDWYSGTVEDDDPEHTVNAPSLDIGAPRWAVDSFNRRSSYATGNQFEWIAEGFTDYLLNGDKAAPGAQKIGNVMHKIYGG